MHDKKMDVADKENIGSEANENAFTPKHSGRKTRGQPNSKRLALESSEPVEMTPILPLSPSTSTRRVRTRGRCSSASFQPPISPPRTRASSAPRRSPPKQARRLAPESTAKKTYKSLQRLRQSNAILEHILAEQRAKEQNLESNLRVLETTLKRTKDVQLRETVRTLNSSLFLLLVAALLWGNWTMFSPHLDAMIMACLVSAIFREWQDRLIANIDKTRTFLTSPLSMKYGSALTALASFIGYYITEESLIAGVSSAGAFLALYALITRTSSRTLSASILTLVLSLGLCAPLVLVLRSCAAEMEFAAKFSFGLLESKERMQALVDSLNNRKFARYILQKTGPAGMIAPEDLIGYVKSAANSFSADSALGLLTNASNLIWAFGVFMATLFSLLQLDLEQAWTNHLARFSPLPSQDNVELYKTIRSSTWQVFAGSATMGAMHGLTTYAALKLVQSPLCVLPAFASTCLAIAPFFGTWLPLAPIVIGYLLMDRELEAMFLFFMQIIALAVLSPWVSSKLPSSAKFIGGLPIVAGLFAWGVCGVVYGPLIVGLSIVTANIYMRYTYAFRPVGAGGADDNGLDVTQMTYLDETQIEELGYDDHHGYSPRMKDPFDAQSFIQSTH